MPCVVWFVCSAMVEILRISFSGVNNFFFPESGGNSNTFSTNFLFLKWEGEMESTYDQVHI